MNSPHPLYRRLPSAPTPPPVEVKATRPQRLLELTLFFVFGAMLLVAAVALVVTSTTQHQSVPNRVAAGLSADRVNVLVLVSTSKEVRDFTEALLLVSVRPSSGEVAVLSIPTDLWVRMGRYGSRRIGSAIAVGRRSGYPGRGAGLVADTVADVFGQPVHGYVQLSPGQLARLIDSVGGVSITSPVGAYESRTGERFVRGLPNHLAGMSAVRYALSSHIAAPANDRFAREQRQRALITALMHAQGLANAPVRLKTNLTPQQAAYLLQRTRGSAPRIVTIEPYVDPFDVSTLAEKGEVLRPTGVHDLQRIAASVFTPAFANR